MSWARNALALAPLPHEHTPPFGCKRSDLRTPRPWPDRQDRQHLGSPDDSFAGHTSDLLRNVLRRVLRSIDH